MARTDPDNLRRALLLAVYALFAAVAAWSTVAGPPSRALAPLLWGAALWLPGAVFCLSPRTLRRPDSYWLPFAAGPVAFGIGVGLGRLAGLPLPAAAGTVVLLGAVAGSLRLALGRDPSRKAAGKGARAFLPRAALVTAGAGAFVWLLGVLPPLFRDPLRVTSDAQLHLPIVQSVLRGDFPPANPFLAGRPLAYFWFYHVVLAGTARLTGLPPALAPALLNAQALAVLLLALDRAGRRLELPPPARAAGLLLAGLGLSPWGWMRLAAAHLTHPQVNWALARAYGIQAYLPLLSPEEPRLAAALTKIAVTNALPMSLALAALAAIPPRARHAAGWVRHGLLVAGSLLFHPAVGGLVAAGLTLRWAGSALRPPPHRPGLRAEASALAAVAAVTAPYALSILHARTGSGFETLHLQPLRALALNLPVLGLWLLAVPALTPAFLEGAGGQWLAVGAPAAALPFFFHLVDGNEYKAIFVLLAILAPVAGAGLVRLTRRVPWAAIPALALFVPTPLLTAGALWRERPPGYLDPAARHAVAHAVAEAGIPPDAVLWRIDPGRDYSPLTFPLGRSTYLADPYALQILGQWRGETALRRRRLLEAARGGGDLGAAFADAARAARPGLLLVAATPEDLRRYPALAGWMRRPSHGEIAFATPWVSVREWGPE